MSDTVGCIYTDCIKRKECSISTAPSEYPISDYINNDNICSGYVKENEKETTNG
jgi:hypothetical protein